MRLVRVVLPLLLLCAASLSADAQKRKLGAKEDAEARAHYQKAFSYYNLREYGIAIIEFKEAYAISNEPLLLFNIAQAYRLDKQYEEALHYYTTYLRLKPNAPNHHDAEEFIGEMEHVLKSDKQLTHDETPPAGATTPPGGALPIDSGPVVPPPLEDTPPAQVSATAAQVAPSLVMTDAPPPRKPIYKRWWLWTGVGVVVAAGVGLGVGLTLGAHTVLPSGSWGSIDARH